MLSAAPPTPAVVVMLSISPGVNMDPQKRQKPIMWKTMNSY
jgi:hypothetical protein